MVKVSIDLFYGEIRFATYLACYFSDIVLYLLVLSYGCTTVTKIILILRYLMESVASKMKTGVTHVTVEDLIGIRIKATKTNLAIGFKELFIDGLSCFGGFRLFHIIQKLLYHLRCFVLSSMLNVTQDCIMHEGFLEFGHL